MKNSKKSLKINREALKYGSMLFGLGSLGLYGATKLHQATYMNLWSYVRDSIRSLSYSLSFIPSNTAEPAAAILAAIPYVVLSIPFFYIWLYGAARLTKTLKYE